MIQLHMPTCVTARPPSCATACLQAVPKATATIAILLIICLPHSTAHADEAKCYMVVVTGSEILAGAFPDGHSYFLTRTLRPLGLQCVGSMTVEDGKADIQAALAHASNRAELVIVTGGLGPTDNDVTCEAISEYTGIAVKQHPDVLANVARRFRTSVKNLQKNVKRQTRVPVQGSYLQNPNGSAVGLVFETGKGAIVALPGPPRELQPMVETQLIPYLSRRFGTRLPGSSLTVRFIGLGQSSIDRRLKQQVTLPEGTSISSQFEGSRVDFTFSLAEDNGENRQKLKKLSQQILEKFPENVYATDGETSLEDVVIALLEERGLKLSLAEIASGGCVGAALASARDSDGVLAGVYVAPDMEAMLQLMARTENTNAAGIDQLAEALSTRDNRRCALVVGPRVEGEDGTGYANVVIRLPQRETATFRTALRGRDPESRARLTTRIVEILRKELLKR